MLLKYCYFIKNFIFEGVVPHTNMRDKSTSMAARPELLSGLSTKNETHIQWKTKNESTLYMSFYFGMFVRSHAEEWRNGYERISAKQGTGY